MGVVSDLGRAYLLGPTASPGYMPVKTDGVVAFDTISRLVDALSGAGGAGAVAFATRSAALAALGYAAGTVAWVYADPTVAYNGIYVKSGASGSGTWTWVKNLPFQIIPLSCSGTANAIVATSLLPIPAGDLQCLLPFVAPFTNTGAVTVIANGAASVALKSSTGADLDPGDIVSGSVYFAVPIGGTYRLTVESDFASAVAAAEAAADRAETAAQTAEEAAATFVYASEAEAIAGTVANKMISPATLKSVTDLIAAGVGGFVNTTDHATPQAAAAYAYLHGLLLVAPVGTVVYLDCNPTAGDDLQAMLAFVSRPHLVDRQCLRLRLADGLHEVNTYFDAYDGIYLCATADPDYVTFTGLSIASLGSNTYEATVTVGSALPARVVVNYPIGISAANGDNGAQSINGSHQVTWIAANRLSFKFQYKSSGVAPTSPTALSSTAIIGLTANQLVIPQCALRVQAGTTGGWDGAAREGFLNFAGDFHTLDGIGFSYNGADDEHDILWIREGGGYVYALRCLFAGSGDKIARSGHLGEYFFNYCLFGGGLTADECWQGLGGSKAFFQRCVMGSFSVGSVTATVDCQVWLNYVIIASAPLGPKTTYPGSLITFGVAHICHCTTAITASNGTVYLTSSTTIKNCTSANAVAGTGLCLGSPTDGGGNTNAWVASVVKKVLATASGTGAPGVITAGATWTGPAITVSGAALGDVVDAACGVAMPAGCIVWGQVSAADTVQIYVSNITAASTASLTNRTFYATVTSRN